LNLNFSSRKSVDLEVTTKKDKIKKVPLEFKNGQEFPEYYGRVQLNGSEIGQKFNIVGEVDSEVTESSAYEEYETCTE
ncbi:MAG: hypothetical protein KDD40_03605, partial [Bdellovibrionales bacterium]|nr:hypothetical protein [Bdellovibrionales bacterium]